MEETTKKKAKRRPTLKQRRAAKALLDNQLLDKPKTEGEVLASVGYGTITQDPKRIIESIGFKQALRDLGLTETFITTALVEDIKGKPQNRIQELKLGAEILGMVKREDDPPLSPAGNTYNFIFSQEVRERVGVIDAEIKEMLTKPHVQTS